MSDSWLYAWLQELNLSEYLTVFSEHQLTTHAQLAQMTKDQLKAIGITKLGHLNRLCKAIEKLSETENFERARSFSMFVSHPNTTMAEGSDMVENFSSSTSDTQHVTSHIPPVVQRQSNKRRSPSPGATLSVADEVLLRSLSPSPTSPVPEVKPRVHSLRRCNTNSQERIPSSIHKSETLPSRTFSPNIDSSLVNTSGSPKFNKYYENVGTRPTSSPVRKPNLAPPPPPPRKSSMKDPDSDSTAEANQEMTPPISPDTPPSLPPKVTTLADFPSSIQPCLSSWDDLLKGEVSTTSITTPTLVVMPTSITTPPSEVVTPYDPIIDAPPLLPPKTYLPPSHAPPPIPIIPDLPPPPLSELPPSPPKIPPRLFAPDFIPPPPPIELPPDIPVNFPSEPPILPPKSSVPNFTPPPPPTSCSPPVIPPRVSSQLSHAANATPTEELKPKEQMEASVPPIPPRYTIDILPPPPPITEEDAKEQMEASVPPIPPRSTIDIPPPPPPITEEDHPESDDEEQLTHQVVQSARNIVDDHFIVVQNPKEDRSTSFVPVSAETILYPNDINNINQPHPLTALSSLPKFDPTGAIVEGVVSNQATNATPVETAGTVYEAIDTSQPIPGTEYEEMSEPEEGVASDHMTRPSPVQSPQKQSLPSVPEGQPLDTTYETIAPLSVPPEPPRPFTANFQAPSSGIYESIDNVSPSTNTTSAPVAPELKTLKSFNVGFTQSFNDYKEHTDLGSKLTRHTERLPIRNQSVKELARDLELKESLKSIRSCASDTILEERCKETISPAASRFAKFADVPPTKEGFLYKRGGRKNDKPWQKRWVVFDGEELKYFRSKGEKEIDARNNVKLSEMIDVKKVTVDPDQNHRFDLVVINRVFQFYADNEDDAQMWINVLHAAISKYNPSEDQVLCKVGGNMNAPDKEGFIMKQGHGRFAGFRQRYVALKGSKFAYYDNKEDFNQGKPIHVLDMRLAMVKPESNGRSRFTITMPNQRSYVFQACNDVERMDWIEKLNNAILTGLNLAPEQKEGKKGVRAADILARIRENPSNNYCADCGSEEPSWSVVNRGIMVCIECSGVHRAMGVHISKVRSVELDVEIWTDTLIQLFTSIGNNNAKKFWECHFTGERIPVDSPREIRESFIRTKYESKAWIPRTTRDSQEVLNKALCVAVANDDLMRTTELLVMGADPCYQNPDAKDQEVNTPLTIAKASHKTLQVELLEQNGALIEAIMDDVSLMSINKKGYLHKTGSDRQGWKRRYCTLDNYRGLEYFKSETDLEILGSIKCDEILGVSQCEEEGGAKDSRHCFEVITTGRAYLFGADTEAEMNDWIGTIKQIIPKDAADKLGYDKVGYLRKKAPQNVTWKRRWFALKNRTLTYFKNDKEEIASIDLRTVTELRGPERGGSFEAQCSFQIVTQERTYALRADTPTEADSWMQALKNTQATIPLSEHELTGSGIPIIVHKCLQFVETYGLQTEGLYRKSGERAKIRKLLLAFNQDPKGVMIDQDQYTVHDVTGVLKQFFQTLPDPLFTHHLYYPFIDAASMTDHEDQMYQLQSLIEQLPDVNRETLKKLTGHLLKVIQNESENKMSQSNIISLFGPTLMTVDTDPISFEDARAQYACINHMLNYYKWLFSVDDDEEKKEEAMHTAMLKIQAAQQQHKVSTMLNSATSFLISIYINNKEGGTCSMKVTVTTTAAEVVEFVTTTKSLPQRNYALFLVLGDAESERPLHSLEHILAVQKPDSYLCIKPNTFADKLLHYDDAYKGQCILLHVQEKKKWRKCPCCVRDNSFVIYKDSKTQSELARIPVIDLDLFVGIEQKKIDVRNPLPTKYPFCLLVRYEEQNKFLCADSDEDRLIISAGVIYAKHPDGIQTPIMPVRSAPSFEIKNRGISILHPMSPPNTSPIHEAAFPNYKFVTPKTVIPKVGTNNQGLLQELKKRGNSLSPERTLS